MLRFRPYKYSLLIMSILLFLLSTGGFAASQEEKKGENDLQEDVAEIKASKSVGDVREYIYDPTGKTDPFRSFITAREEKAEEDKKKPKTYLETLELSQLSLSTIVIGKRGKWAIVKDSKDKGHEIKEGTLIGRNGGVVYRINEGEVIIREMVKDFRGNINPKDKIMKSRSQ